MKLQKTSTVVIMIFYLFDNRKAKCCEKWAKLFFFLFLFLCCVQARHYFWAKVRPWRERITSYTVPTSKCVKAPHSRDNHNGNGPGGQSNRWSFVVPKGLNGTCVMKIRYNISTGDYANTHDASFNKSAAKGMLNELIHMHPRVWGILLFQIG